MSDSDYGATIARRRLARHLRRLRFRSGYTARQVTDHFGWPRGQLLRLEHHQWQRVDPQEIRRLISFYNASPAEEDELEALVVFTSALPWWHDYRDIITNDFPGLENDASAIYLYSPSVLPDLLQTRQYAKAQVRSIPVPATVRRRILEVREFRQGILHAGDRTTPRIFAVIHESSLLDWGSEQDRLEQIQHLVWLAGRDEVAIQLLRSVDGFIPPVIPSVTHLEFDGDEPSIAFMQSNYHFHEIDENEGNNSCLELIRNVSSLARDVVGTSAYLEELSGKPVDDDLHPAGSIQERLKARKTVTPWGLSEQQMTLKERRYSDPRITFVQLGAEASSATLELHPFYYTFYWQTHFTATDFIHYLNRGQGAAVAVITVAGSQTGISSISLREAVAIVTREAKGAVVPEWGLVRFDGPGHSLVWQYAPGEPAGVSQQSELTAFVGCASTEGHMRNFNEASELLRESAVNSESLCSDLHLLEHYLDRWTS